MALSNTQIELIKTIRDRLQRGDIAEIATQTKFTREYVGKALNISTEFFNEHVIEAAIKLIAKREKLALKNLEMLNAENAA